jgi:ribosomal protein S27E
MVVRIDRKNCRHIELYFGSGDFYLFCLACGAVWATVDVGSQKAEAVAAELANQGIGSTLSGEKRSASKV